MFGFLKDKLKKTISSFSKKIEEEGKEEVVEEPIQQKPKEEEKQDVPEKKEGFFQRLKHKFAKKEDELEQLEEEEAKEEEKKAELEEEIKEVREEETKTEEKEEKIIEKEPAEKELKKSKKEEIKQELEEKKEEKKEIKKEKEEPDKTEKIKELKEKEKRLEEDIEKEEEKLEDIKKKEEKLEKEVDEIQQEAAAAVVEDIGKQIEEEQKEEKEPEKEEYIEKEAEGFFGKLKQKFVTKKISEAQFDEMFWDLELGLLENNVAVEVIEKIKSDMKNNLVDKPIKRSRITDTITMTLKDSIEELFVEKIDLVKKSAEKKPYIISFVGINGSGKTTSIAKVAHILMKNKKSVVLAAADTFRAAAIQQLEEHAKNLGIKMIKHDYGSDAAAVAFDAVKYAEAHNLDVVLIDTAGRLHSNVNLMDELKKVNRVSKPDMSIFVGESITGNDCVEQAKKFNEVVGIDGIILTKADVDEKGGAAISVSYVTKKPILYIGVGQGYDDLVAFDPNKIIETIFG